MGWSEGALISGARDVGVSPSIVGSFARKEAALVEVCKFIIEMLIYRCPFHFIFLKKNFWSDCDNVYDRMA